MVGVRYRDADPRWHEVRAPLTAAADGRHSKVRALAGFEPLKSSPPMDVLWTRVPKAPGDARCSACLATLEMESSVMPSRLPLPFPPHPVAPIGPARL